MRRIVCSVFALCCCSLVLAQEKTRSLSVELLGAQNVVGVNYDSRFKFYLFPNYDHSAIQPFSHYNLDKPQS